jgi:hypothetical protein
MGILDGTIEFDPMDKYLAQTATTADAMGLPETLLHGAVATVADIGTTYWNSLTPDTYNVETADLLSRIDKDALQVYNEHPDAIKTASFIGGMVAPIGLSVKGMSMLRAGTKGLSWFSTAGQASRLAAVETAFAEAGKDAAFNLARREVYKAMAFNAVADNIAAEIAIVGALSAHPYMEDYHKDFASNFLMSVAFGTGIQATLGGIIAKGTIARSIGKIEAEAPAIVKSTTGAAYKEADISPISHLGEVAAAHAQGVENLKAIINKAEDASVDFTLSPYTLARLKTSLQTEEATLAETLKASAQGTFADFLDTAPREVLDHFVEFVGDSRNAGLDKIGFAAVKGNSVASAGEEALKDTGALFGRIMKKLTDSAGLTKEIEQTVKTDLIYSPVWDGSYISKKDAPSYLTLADLGKTVKELEASAAENLGRHPNVNWAISMVSKNTAQLEGDYASAVLRVNQMEAKELANLVISPDDLPLVKAVVNRGRQLAEADPELVLNIKVTKQQASYEAVRDAYIARVGGVSPTYLKDLEALTQDLEKTFLYDSHKPPVSFADIKTTSDTIITNLRDWVRGDTEFLRLGGLTYRSGLSAHITKEAATAKSVVSEIYNTAESQAARSLFSGLADEEGNIWLTRGLGREPLGHRGIESYAITVGKAGTFGADLRLYKVHVDDILAVINDTGSRQFNNVEVLVLPPTRENAILDKGATVPDKLLLDLPKEVPVSGTPSTTAVVTNLNDMEALLKQSMSEAIQNLKASGYGIETISLKTGTPVDTIKQIIETGHVSGAGLFKYTGVEDIAPALDFRNRALALSTDMNKVPEPEVYAKLDQRNLKATSDGLLQMYLFGSKSELVRQYADMMYTQDMSILSKHMYDEVQKVTQSELKTTLFSSSNQVLEAFGPLGSMATAIGKNTIHLKNTVTEIFEKPIAALMGQILKKGDAHLLEANTATAVYASVTGKRIFKDGRFWIPSEKVTGADFRQLIKAKDEEFLAYMEQNADSFSPAQFKGKDYKVASEEVKTLMSKLQEYGREMYELKNSRLKAIGRPELPDIGMWMPSFNPRNKEVAYVYDKAKDTTSMLYADTEAELLSGIADYKKSLIAQYGPKWENHIRIVPKSEQADYNMLAGRHDSMHMQSADITKQHGGSSTPTIVATDTSIFSDILQGYQHHIHDGIEKIVELQLNDTMNVLKNLSDLSKGVHSEAALGTLKKLSSKNVDPGQVVRNILLGKPSLTEHTAWNELQQRVQVGTDFALKTVADFFQPILAPITNKVTGANLRTPESWAKTLADMKESGIMSPFEGVQESLGLNKYLREGTTDNEGLTPRLVALGNGLAATSLLKVLEVAQPLVNAMSLPILTSAAINRKMASSYLGATLDPSAKFSVFSAMIDGVRLMNHPELGKHWGDFARTKGDFDVGLREVSEILEHKKSLDPGVLTTLEKATESKLVAWLSTLSTKSEEIVREIAYFTGISMAKKAYPGISDTGAYVFARNFIDETVGNYTSAQRPAAFQGVVGSGMALFQTYMLTMAQSMYRQIEHRDWASLGKMLLTQSTIFGASSLPGFHVVSEAIGTHFSDQHFDLETGTFRAIPDPIANIILYGLPSSFGPGFTTRGDIQPRLPNPTNVDSIAAINIAKQAYTSMEHVAAAAFSSDGNTGQALLEAISLQSVSRPIARAAELLSGHSITSRGDVVASPAELYTTQGIIARVLSTRPLEEIKIRETFQLNSVYGKADAQNRRAVTARLKSYIRNGSTDPEALDKMAEEYLRTGTTTGWRAAVTDAIRQSAVGGQATSISKLKEDSPLNRMIEDRD